MVQGFFLLLIETLGIFGRFLFLPPFDHLCHLKSGVPSPPPPPTGCVYVNIDSAMATEFGHDHVLQNLQFSLQTVRTCYSRGQHLCRFMGTKESVYIRKEFNSHRTGLGNKHGRRFIVLGHKYGRHGHAASRSH